MKELLVEGYLLLLDDKDYEYLKDKKIDLRIKDGVVYPVINLHRMHFDTIQKGQVVDHINRNTLDCRKENLRVATYSENNANKGPRLNKSSLYKGVCWNTKDRCWVASLSKGDLYVFLGRFNEDEENIAARSYDIASLYFHKDFAYTNYPIENYKTLDLKEELFNIINKKPRNNTTGFRGVTLDKRAKSISYIASVKYNKRPIYLGTFKAAKDAAIARDNWYRENNMVSSIKLNFPTFEELISYVY